MMTGALSGRGMVGESIAPSLADRDAGEARSDALSCLLVLFWLVGTIFLDKAFAYLRIGPLFITEITLGVLILNNINRLRLSDVVLAGAVLLYVVIGAMKHGSFMFAVKDVAWMYYLFFVRFFPRNFPESYIRIVIVAAVIKVFLVLVLPGELKQWTQKYCDSIIILFCFLLVVLHRDGRVEWPLYFLFLFSAIAFPFKTLLLLLLLSPFIMHTRFRWEGWLRPGPMFGFVVVFVVAVMLDLTRHGLVLSVVVLNLIADFFNLGMTFETGTAVWRAEIWTNALNRLWADGEILFGQFPGFNFMDNRYLGVNLHLQGGQGLGVVRTGHCIIVQMVMNAGLIGVVLYFWYLFRNLPNLGRICAFFVAAVFLLAMTADILEVPSRGPLFYCLLVLLIRKRDEKKAGIAEAEPGEEDDDGEKVEEELCQGRLGAAP